MFKAIPDSGEVTITKDLPSSTLKNGHGCAVVKGTSVRFRRNILRFDRQHFGNAGVMVALYNVSGKLVARYVVKGSESQVAIPAALLTRSAVIAKVTGSDRSWSGMVTTVK